MRVLISFFVFGSMLVAGGLSHISHSEFWPLSLSREFWNFSTTEIGVFYKPTFHGLLSSLYLLPLSNWEHVIGGRAIFSILAGLTFLLSYRWMSIEFGLQRNTKNLAILAILFLSPIFLLQVVKMRSDILALFALMLLLNLTISQGTWSSRRYFLIFAVHVALLAATPRALNHSLMAVVITFVSIRSSGHWGAHRRQWMMTLLAPFVCALIVGQYAVLTLLPLQNYLLNSFREGLWQLDLIWNSLKLDLFLLAFMVVGFFLVNQSKARWYFLLATLLFLLADLKTPYLWASYFPLFVLPLAVFSMRWISQQNAKVSGLALGLLATVAVGNFIWQAVGRQAIHSNLQQREVVQDLSRFLEAHPDYLFFDGLGVLPRSKQLLSYLGPNDFTALDGIKAKWQQTPPDLILVTARTFLMGESFTNTLETQYRPIGPNVFLANKRPGPEKQIEFSSIPYLIFGL